MERGWRIWNFMQSWDQKYHVLGCQLSFFIVVDKGQLRKIMLCHKNSPILKYELKITCTLPAARNKTNKTDT